MLWADGWLVTPSGGSNVAVLFGSGIAGYKPAADLLDGAGRVVLTPVAGWEFVWLVAAHMVDTPVGDVLNCLVMGLLSCYKTCPIHCCCKGLVSDEKASIHCKCKGQNIKVLTWTTVAFFLLK